MEFRIGTHVRSKKTGRIGVIIGRQYRGKERGFEFVVEFVDPATNAKQTGMATAAQLEETQTALFQGGAR